MFDLFCDLFCSTKLDNTTSNLSNIVKKFQSGHYTIDYLWSLLDDATLYRKEVTNQEEHNFIFTISFSTKQWHKPFHVMSSQSHEGIALAL